jgi:hypothetical protein
MDLRRLTLPADKANHVIWGLVVALFFAWLAARAGYPQHAGRTTARRAAAASANRTPWTRGTWPPRPPADWAYGQRALRWGCEHG